MHDLITKVVSSLEKKRASRHFAALLLQKTLITHLTRHYPHIPPCELFVQYKPRTIRIITHQSHLHRLIRLHRPLILEEWKVCVADTGRTIDTAIPRLSFGDPELYLQGTYYHN